SCEIKIYDYKKYNYMTFKVENCKIKSKTKKCFYSKYKIKLGDFSKMILMNFLKLWMFFILL
ncbi:MAG: hypothetical protein ABF289_06575, partial [Clostridiales bacterium]